MTKPKQTTKCACFVDSSVGDPTCVLDEGRPDDCDEAYGLTCKEECRYWRSVGSMQAAAEADKQRHTARVLIKRDAFELRAEADRRALQFDLDLADAAPVFKGSFGHGAYYRKK